MPKVKRRPLCRESGWLQLLCPPPPSPPPALHPTGPSSTDLEEESAATTRAAIAAALSAGAAQVGDELLPHESGFPQVEAPRHQQPSM